MIERVPEHHKHPNGGERLKGYVEEEEHVCWGLRVSCWILNTLLQLLSGAKKDPLRLLKFNARPTIPVRAQGLKEVGPPRSSSLPPAW